MKKTDIKMEKAHYQELTARLDRLPSWGLPLIILPALGLSFFMTLYDADAIAFALPYITFITAAQGSLIASMGLIAYAIGAILFSYLSDIFGRKALLIITATLAAIGSIGDAVSIDFISLLVFRIVAGLSIGADLVLVMAYMIEMSPGTIRGKLTNMVFIIGAAGIGFGNLLASYLVLYLPVNLGWRLIFGIGGSLAILALLLRVYLPESIRFLCIRGRYSEAEDIVSKMEKKSMKITGLDVLPAPVVLNYTLQKSNPFGSIFRGKTKIRLSILLSFQFFFYFADYAYAVLLPTWVKSLNLGHTYFNSFISIFGYVFLMTFVSAVILRYVIDSVDRRKLLILVTTLYTAGSTISGFGITSRNIYLTLIGMVLALFALGWIQVNYTVFADNFPTQGRATGMALTDGGGHIGGAIGLILLLPVLAILGGTLGWLVYWLPALGLAFVVLMLTPYTNKSRLEEINEMANEVKSN